MPAAATLPNALLLQAARAWRSARDAHRPAQPAVHAVLAPEGLELLTPAIDSLMALCEHRLDRPLCTGCPFAPSDDERMLCRLLADPSGYAPCPAREPDGLARAFAGALASVRVMAAMHARGAPGVQ